MPYRTKRKSNSQSKQNNSEKGNEKRTSKKNEDSSSQNKRKVSWNDILIDFKNSKIRLLKPKFN